MKTLTWIGLIALLLAGVSALALPPRGSGFKPPMRPYVIDNDTHIDANLIDMFVTNHGSFAWDLITGDPGLTYPKGTDKQAVFASGLWMGALIDGVIHTVVAEYSTEYQPGDMVDVGPNPGYNDPHYRVYKIDNSSGPGDADWDEWPWAEGAPVDSTGDPLLLGDQTLWCVYNDADPIEHSNDAGNSAPLGIEIQQTTFAYNRAGPLGEIVFLKFLFINKGENFLEDTYVALWSDPDLGGAGDDLVGCDTMLSVGYCYNATNNDQVYGTTPPCVGYDFFQGPIVPSPGDTAWVSGEGYVDFRNLPMTAFNKYINGTDPHSATETYWYMEGLNAVEGEGGPYIFEGDTTTFFGWGDPVTNTGWLDDNAADRRFMLVSGPFDLDPISENNDEVLIGVNAQEVVAAIVMGQGTDRLNSITVMKQNDDAAQKVFDANFNIPNPPPQPSVYVQARDGYINLIWGTEADGDLQRNLDLGQEFHFEGFNLYQGWSVAGPWKKIGTFDEVNEYTYTDIDTVTGDTTIITSDLGIIYMDVFSAAAGGMQRVIVQNGSNSGLVHNFVIDTDALLGGPMVNFKEYFFAVTAYNFEVNNAVPFLLGPNVMGWVSEALENATNPISCIPGSQGLQDEIEAQHTAGAGDGSCTIHYIPECQEDVTGHTYQVNFEMDTVESVIMWKCTDVTANTVVIDSQTNQSGDFAYPIFDGIMVRVVGPEEGIKGIWETATAAGPLEEWDNVAYSWNSTGDWYVSSDAGSDFSRMNYQGIIGVDNWELRFVELDSGSQYYFWDTETLVVDTITGDPIRCPFQAWNMGPDDDPADDKRIQIAILDDEEPWGWSAGDRIYLSERDYYEPLPDPMEYTWPDDFHIGRIIFNVSIPAGGTVVLFETNKVHSEADVYRFTTENPWLSLDWDLDDVKVVPNPYYGHSSYELDPYQRRVKFINLPKEVKIRIFNLGGDHIRTLEKNDTTTELFWDLETKHGIPVASGIYIWYLDAPGIGTKEGKTAVFMERETLNTF